MTLGTFLLSVSSCGNTSCISRRRDRLAANRYRLSHYLLICLLTGGTGLFNEAVSSDIASTGGMSNERRIIKDINENSRGILRHYPVLPWEGLQQPRKSPIRTVGVLAKIRKGTFPNTSRKRYCLSQLATSRIPHYPVFRQRNKTSPTEATACRVLIKRCFTEY